MLFYCELTAELLKIYDNTPGILVIYYHLLFGPICYHFAHLLLIIRFVYLAFFKSPAKRIDVNFHLAVIYIGAFLSFGNCCENKSLLCKHS
jgi:hypothetical protein